VIGLPGFRKSVDLILLTTTLVLLTIGVVMVFSASSVTAHKEHGDPYHYLKRQLMWALIGCGAMVLMMNIDYHIYRAVALPGIIVSYLLLIAVLLIGPEIGGSKRWIPLGFMNIQPSEITKLAVVCFLATYLTYIRKRVGHFLYGVLVPLATSGLAFILIVGEPDFGTGVAILCVTFLMLFAAGARIQHLGLVGTASVPCMAVLVYLEPYRLRRLMAFVDPWADPMDSGWNVIQSLLAIGSGGLFGLGLGQGRQKFLYLPEPHTDFIFAILGEELGFIGTSFVVVLFMIFAWRGFGIALAARDLFGTLLAGGITSMIVFQALLNIGVVSGSLPVTGIPLPLISFGGSSLVITMAGIGILLNISKATGAA